MLQQIQPADLTRLCTHSLEDWIKSTQHIWIITNCCSSLHGPVVISHQEWLYLSGAKDNNGWETRDGDPEHDVEGKKNTQTKRKKSVTARKGDRESDGGNTIKGNECQSVIPAVWSKCLCQLSWQPEVRCLSPCHWGKARFQCQNAGLVIGFTRDSGYN